MTRPDSAHDPGPPRPAAIAIPFSASEAPDIPDGPESVSAVARQVRTVLGADEIGRAMRRMAHEIVEGNHGVDGLVVLGIPTRGVPLGQRLAALISDIEGRPVPVGTLDVSSYRDDRSSRVVAPVAPTSIPDSGIDDRVVVLTDDVLYSGRTVRAALDAVADLGRPRAVRLAVLVDRGHRDLPIRADHVGKNLPTSSRERVHVRLQEIDRSDRVDISEGRS